MNMLIIKENINSKCRKNFFFLEGALSLCRIIVCAWRHGHLNCFTPPWHSRQGAPYPGRTKGRYDRRLYQKTPAGNGLPSLGARCLSTKVHFLQVILIVGGTVDICHLANFFDSDLSQRFLLQQPPEAIIKQVPGYIYANRHRFRILLGDHSGINLQVDMIASDVSQHFQ